MVLYFSATGNTRYVAQALAEVLRDELTDMTELIKTGKHQRFNSEKPYIICAPIYAWRFPRIVESFISKSDFWGNDKMYFVATCESQSGDAGAFLKRICEEKNMRFMGFTSIAMPESYIIMYDAPDEEQCRKLKSDAVDDMTVIAQATVTGQPISDKRKMPFKKAASKLGNAAFYSLLVSNKKFYATDKCVGCGKCEKVCPMGCISLKEGKPQWSGKCIHCTACLNRCPKQAIEYGRKTQGKKRYFNDTVLEVVIIEGNGHGRQY